MKQQYRTIKITCEKEKYEELKALLKKKKPNPIK